MGKVDIRLGSINDNLKTIKNKLIVLSPKGGVGKTTFSFILSLYLSKKNKKVGVWDLDITNPNLHILFNSNLKFTELNGIEPPTLYNNIKFLSLIQFIDNDILDNNSISLRGRNISEVILELLTITNWGNLDFLIIDTPPTLTDIFLDLLKYISNSYFVVVSTNSILSIKSTVRILNFFKKMEIIPLALVVNDLENLKDFRPEYYNIQKEFNLPYLLKINYIKNIQDYYSKDDILKEVDTASFDDIFLRI
jgi:ATP-binding protein involved in chromosome partitioning